MELKHTRETRWQASELKFLVTPECAARLKTWARRHLEADPYGDSYLTTSLYFDTPRLDVFHEKGSYGHAKYRVRRYGDARHVFLERKLRNDRLVVKRRSSVDIGELARLGSGEPPDPARDDFWFHRRIAARGLSPVCQIAYQRTALMAAPDDNLVRLTIDENLHAIDRRLPVFDDSREGSPILDDALVVEMKFRNSLPDLFRAAIEDFALEQRTFSKYKLAARQLGLAEVPSLLQTAV